MGLLGIFIPTWYICIFVQFNYLNRKKPKLFVLWMKITNQIPNDQLAGLSKRKNNEFWKKENSLFIFYLKYIYKLIIIMTSLIVSYLRFYIQFEVNVYVFYFVQLLHLINHSIYVYGRN
jgi:hypothetical protein